MRVGVVLSGGQASGGHNVIAGKGSCLLPLVVLSHSVWIMLVYAELGCAKFLVPRTHKVGFFYHWWW
jgi:hypothetical protein